MSTKAQIVTDFIENVINRGEIDRAEEYFWPDMVELVPFPGQGPGVEGLKDVLRGMRAAFTNLNWTVEEQVAEGDKVVTRFVMTGVQEGPFLGVPASGRNVAVWGVVIDRFEGEKIKDTRLIMDALGLMIQLGAIPVPGA